MKSRAFALTLSLASLVAVVTAQQSPNRTAAQPGSRVAGIVVSAEDGKSPIRRAMVTIEGPSQFSQITDEDGRFVFEGVIAGEYQVTATRAAFLAANYGARRPGRLPSRLSIPAATAIDDVTLYMARGAAIEGIVRDINGEPAPNVGVVVSPAGDIQLMTAILGAPWTTDDRGVYRAYGLAPGSYVVYAIPQHVRRGEMVQPSLEEMDAALRSLTDKPSATSAPRVQFNQTVSYGPVFHPSASTIAQAGVITVAAGEERSGVDVSLTLVPTRAIDGIVLDPSGQPGTQIQLFISGNGTPNPVSFDAAPIMTGRSTTLGAGRFRYTNVTAGQYTITAKRQGDPPLFAQTVVDVTGSDVLGLQLRLRPALVVNGRIVFKGRTAPPTSLASVRITMTPPAGGGGGMGNLTNYGLGTSLAVNADDDGNFVLNIIPGPYVAGSFIPGNNAATGWWLQSAMINGLDAVDIPATIDSANANVVLTFSDQHTELSGTLSTAANQPATDHYVVVIPSDRRLWQPNSRRMAIARPSTAGRYVFANLPPGEYLLAAVTDFATTDFKDKTILEQLASAGVKVQLTDGAKVVQDLRIGGLN